MPPPHDGNEYLPFANMIALEKINEATYRSIALPFSPGGSGRAYGGHVYAQAVWAAAQTVSKGFVVHVCTTLYTKPKKNIQSSWSRCADACPFSVVSRA